LVGFAAAGRFHFREYPDKFHYNVMHFVDYWEHQPRGAIRKAAGSHWKPSQK
jgi:hypothetical protein